MAFAVAMERNWCDSLARKSKMTEAKSKERTLLERAADALLRSGHALFSLAIIALGVETFVCTGSLAGTLIHTDRFGRILGSVLAALGAGLLVKRTARTAAMSLGTLLFLYALAFDLPKCVERPGSIVFRTQLFEPLAIAALAWLVPGRDAIPGWLERASRYLLAMSFIVFGVDHFLGLAFIGKLIPAWLPWHVFWIGFFGAGFIAAGFSIGFHFLVRWGAACVGLMFAIWVFTLHLPRACLGLYGGRPHNPAEWSSLFIAIALWGGSWALASSVQVRAHHKIGSPPLR
jgi:uncharacterized membrane protein